MKKWMVGILLLASVLNAQESSPVWKQKVFDVKYIDPRPIASLINDMRVKGDTRVNANTDLRVVSIGTYEDRLISLAEELIKKYDVPGSVGPVREKRNIELTAHLILAAPTGTSGSALPGDLDGVAKQLKAVFGYNDLKLLDGVILRNREGLPGETDGSPGKMNPDLPDYIIGRYQLRYNSMTLVPGEKSNVVRIDNLKFTTRVPYIVSPAKGDGQVSFQFQDVGFSSNLDIREGQKVVVAKNKIDNSDKALILVVSARAVD